jgi:hypothetical protein
MTAVGISLRWPHDTLYPLKFALTSPTSGGRTVGIVRWRTKAPEFVLFLVSREVPCPRRSSQLRIGHSHTTGGGGRWIWSQKLREKSSPTPFRPPEISCDIIWDWNQGSAVREQRLTAWAIEYNSYSQIFRCMTIKIRVYYLLCIPNQYLKRILIEETGCNLNTTVSSVVWHFKWKRSSRACLRTYGSGWHRLLNGLLLIAGGWIKIPGVGKEEGDIWLWCREEGF